MCIPGYRLLGAAGTEELFFFNLFNLFPVYAQYQVNRTVKQRAELFGKVDIRKKRVKVERTENSGLV